MSKIMNLLFARKFVPSTAHIETSTESKLPWVKLLQMNICKLFQCNLVKFNEFFPHQFMSILNKTEIYRLQRPYLNASKKNSFVTKYWYCICKCVHALRNQWILSYFLLYLRDYCMDAIKMNVQHGLRTKWGELRCIIVVIIWIAQLLVIISTHFRRSIVQ